jgi:hypothetical protein
VDLFPSAKAQLLIDDVSITCKIPQAIQFAAGLGPIQKYLKTRNTWTDQILKEVDWEAHGNSHSYHQSQHCFLVKLCHHHLPLGKPLHRRNTKYSPICPGCQDNTKDQHHFLQCAAPSRIMWWLTMLTKVHTQLSRMHMNAHLQETIIDCIDKALSGRAVTPNGPFQSAMESQSQIGWLGMMRVYWSIQWQKEYEQTYEALDEETRKDKNKWSLQMGRWHKQLIKTIWGSLITLWQTRNDERHGWDKES